MEMLAAHGPEIAELRNPMRSILPAEEQRREPRIDCGGQLATLHVRGRASPAQAINISVHGAMIETAARPGLDEHVVIAFDGCTPIHAWVRWVKDGRIGLHFGREMLLA
jgi:hypothetical protein